MRMLLLAGSMPRASNGQTRIPLVATLPWVSDHVPCAAYLPKGIRVCWQIVFPSGPPPRGADGRVCGNELHSRPTRAGAGGNTDGCYLVDPASSHMLVSKIKPCMFKKLVVGPWVGSIGPPLVCTGRVVPSAGDALLALTGRVVPPDSDPIVLAFGIGVMINRDSRGHSYFIVRGEILGFMKDEQLRKHLPRMFSLIKNESWGLEGRSDTVLVSTINDADQGSADVAFRTPLAPYEKSKSLGSGGSMVARLKLKGIDGRAPPGVEPAA
ncbi:hypothetical protein VNO80_34023 [Phaseolus coccineus]|uniref:Uncharacterized protein n=1 Tax=Phaseolus coccineus TaxID=3886 RepID=A0AAN9KXV7_PHACN